MRLSKSQKDIIKHIKCNEITDIYSFVQFYNYGYEIQHDRKKIEEEFQKKNGKKEFRCEKDTVIGTPPIVKEIDKKNVIAKPKLSFMGSLSQNLEHNGIKKEFNLYKPVYICENIDAIISFIALWQYLKSEGLIIELPKSCSKEDMGLFLQKKVLKSENMDVSFEEPLSLSDMVVNVNRFLEWEYTLDKESFEVCLPYLTKKLYPAPELSTYIANRYKTLEEKRETRTVRIAFAGVVIALLSSIASIFVSLQDNGYYKELQEINFSLQEIHKDLSK